MSEPMEVAYIAGPYRSRWPWPFRWLGVAWNICRARRMALKYWGYGFAVLCPHSNTALFDGKQPDAVWLAGDLELMARCDVAVMMRGWRNSDGAVAEHAEAKRLGKRIIYDGYTRIARSETVSEPGAAIHVTRIVLTEEGRKALTTGVRELR